MSRPGGRGERGAGAKLEDTPGYLTDQLLTYIGNKRALIPEIDRAVRSVKGRLGKERLRVLDAFSGSGVVARYLKRHAAYLAAIDIEDYAAVVARCYLRNRSTVDTEALAALIDELNEGVDTADLTPGFIEELYAPRCEENITARDRVFYTRRNARRLDNYRRLIERAPAGYRDLLLGPLLSEASVHANTSGVFKGFHKDRNTKKGRFGGTNADALTRIRGDITLAPPSLSRFECEVAVFQGDCNQLAPTIPDLDLVYLDPPYNQHPYGSNYFMLNLLASYIRPEKISPVSGIPADWRRSQYNVRSRSRDSFHDLLKSLETRFLLISFNDEGFISREEMAALLAGLGKVEVVDIEYNTYRGCRNIRNRPVYVTEQLFLVERRPGVVRTR
jgi:adenine-specific DNA-methyltransferase